MDAEQEQLNQPTAGALGGQRPSKAANGGLGPTMSPKPDDAHTLSSKEAAQLFEQAGIPRSQRSIERYCESGKLDCIIDPDEKHWYASQKSVDLLIGQLKELQTRHQPTVSANAGQVPTPPSEEQEEASQGSAAEVQDLKDQISILDLDKKVKDRLLIRAKEEKREDRQDLLEYSYRIGQLETQVHHLELENIQLKGLPPAPTGDKNVESNVEGLQPEVIETKEIEEVPGEPESLTLEGEEEEQTKEPPVGGGEKKRSSWWRQ